MRKVYALLGVIGGLLWAIKAGYDWLGLGRVINRGYLPSDPTDYIEFLFPILCTGSLIAMTSYFRARFSHSQSIAAVGLLLIGAFHFLETYTFGLGIPYGAIFLLGGSLFMLMGLYMLLIKLWKARTAPRLLTRLVAALFVATCFFCLSPFLTGALPSGTATAITVTLMSLIGLIWAGIGGLQVMNQSHNEAH